MLDQWRLWRNSLELSNDRLGLPIVRLAKIGRRCELYNRVVVEAANHLESAISVDLENTPLVACRHRTGYQRGY